MQYHNQIWMLGEKNSMDWMDTAAHIKCEIFLDEIHIVLFYCNILKLIFVLLKRLNIFKF